MRTSNPAVLNDDEIRTLCDADVGDDMIYPFEPAQVKRHGVEVPPNYGVFEKVISYGTSSFGYDARLGSEVKIFTEMTDGDDIDIDPSDMSRMVLSTTLDIHPHPRDPHSGRSFVRLPPHASALAHTVERFKIPRDVIAICLGKSTYARCFTGDTRVALIDGTAPTFTELVSRWEQGEREIYGYGHSQTHGYVVQPLVMPRQVGTERVVEVTLDNGRTVRCTPDHMFCMRDGTSKQAEALKAGDSLLPLYLNDTQGYTRVWDPKTRKYRAVAHLADDMLVRQGCLPPKAVGVHIHHIDQCKTNNNPSNLTRIDPAEHSRLHNADKDLSEQSKAYWADPERKAAHLSRLHAPESRQAAVAGRLAFNATPAGQAVTNQRIAKVWAQRGDAGRKAQADLMRKLKLRADITAETLTAALLEAGTIRGAAAMLKVDRSAFRRLPEVIAAFKAGTLQNNHKVISVRETDDVVPVYCLTAPDTGNFALDAGVIVHNCGIIVNVTPLEPGWEGQVTLEIVNTTPRNVRLWINEGICQFVFLTGNPPSTSYADRKGKYQGQSGITLPRA